MHSLGTPPIRTDLKLVTPLGAGTCRYSPKVAIPKVVIPKVGVNLLSPVRVMVRVVVWG